MNKILRIATIALFVVMFSYNQASAGLFDWINPKAPLDLANAVIDGDNLLFDQIYGAITSGAESNSRTALTAVQGNAVAPAPGITATGAKRLVKKTYTVSASAYSSTPDQTDDTPFITAWNTYVRDGIVATNFLPFGTRIKIPEVFGNKVFVVEDRMNKRYHYNVDVWFADRESAKQFGRRTLTIEVL